MRSIYAFPFDRDTVAGSMLRAAAKRAELSGVVRAAAVLGLEPPGEPIPAPGPAPSGGEYRAFFDWFESRTAAVQRDTLRSGLAYVWYCLIAPAGEESRAVAGQLADRSFDRAEKSGRRYVRVSEQLAQERDARERALRDIRENGGVFEVTDWLRWFCGCYERAVERAIEPIERTIAGERFWSRHRAVAFNQRQFSMLERLRAGKQPHLTAKVWSGCTGASLDTASRDLRELVAAGILIQQGAARSTRYVLAKE